MKKTFKAAEFGKADSQGDIILPSAYKAAKRVLITKDFDPSKLISVADEVYFDGNDLKVTAEIPDEYLKLTPAIGFQIIESEVKDGVRYITDMKLLCVSLCESENIDPGIKPIKDQ